MAALMTRPSNRSTERLLPTTLGEVDREGGVDKGPRRFGQIGAIIRRYIRVWLRLCEGGQAENRLGRRAQRREAFRVQAPGVPGGGKRGKRCYVQGAAAAGGVAVRERAAVERRQRRQPRHRVLEQQHRLPSTAPSICTGPLATILSA